MGAKKGQQMALISQQHRYALLVGINYEKTASELNGCINDVTSIRDYLIRYRGYEPHNIMMLTDHTEVKPTQQNIMASLTHLISQGCHTPHPTELWFHYSGHGSHVADENGDERDGDDEVIVPLDYRTAGCISDDILHGLISQLPARCSMVCLMDCCHSGSILDLMYRYSALAAEGPSAASLPWSPVTEDRRSGVKANVRMISGCMDCQTSADAWINRKFSGAMTAAFLQVMGYEPRATSASDSAQSDLPHGAGAAVDRISCQRLLGSMCQFMKENCYEQIPQLCTSTLVDGEDAFLPSLTH